MRSSQREPPACAITHALLFLLSTDIGGLKFLNFRPMMDICIDYLLQHKHVSSSCGQGYTRIATLQWTLFHLQLCRRYIYTHIGHNRHGIHPGFTWDFLQSMPSCKLFPTLLCVIFDACTLHYTSHTLNFKHLIEMRDQPTGWNWCWVFGQIPYKIWLGGTHT